MKIKSTFAAPFLLLVVLALLTVSGRLNYERLGGNTNVVLTSVILELLVYALPAVFYCRLRGADFTRRLRLRLFSPQHAFLLLLALLAMIAGGALINLLVQKVAPAAEFSAAAADDHLFYTLFAVCILPAVLEEFLFRSIVIAEYETVSVPFAVIISAVLFAMLHLSFRRFPVYLYCGVILALVLYATRSVLAAMVVHALNNVAALWSERAVGRVAAAAGGYSTLFVFLLISILLAVLILFFMESQRIYAAYGADAVPAPYVRRRKKGEESGVLPALIAPPFVLYVLAFAILTLLKI